MNNLTKSTLMTAIWLFNPVIGCSQEKSFEFAEADMVELMESVSEASWTVEQEATTFEVHFELEKGDVNYDEDAEDESEGAFGSLMPAYGMMSSAQACGTRSFLAEADACIDNSVLSVIGTVTITNADSQEIVIEESIDGRLDVMGTVLDNAELILYGDSSSFSFSSPDGLEFEIREATF